MSKRESVLVISDFHAPFEHVDAVAFLAALKKKEGPTKIVCIGDEADFHAISQFDPDPDGMAAGAELGAAISHLRPLYKLFPTTSVCVSNHTSRPFRAGYRFGLPAALFKSYREFLKAPRGWEWADKWEIDGVIYEHGEGQSGAQGAIRAALGNMQSTTIGHIHAFAGVQFSANPRHLVFGFNVGCLIDKDKYAFAYGKHIKTKPIIGAGIVERGIPRFIPMQLKSNGRWIGKL